MTPTRDPIAAFPTTLRVEGARDDADALLERLLPVVTGWCVRLCPPGVDTDVVAADVLLTLHRRRAELRPGLPVEPWALAVTRNIARNHRRGAWFRRWWGGEVDTRTDRTPERAVGASEQGRLVHEILAAVAEEHRVVLVLCDLEERSRPEVAELLGIPVGTVKSRLRTAREAFRAEAARRGLALGEEADDERP